MPHSPASSCWRIRGAPQLPPPRRDSGSARPRLSWLLPFGGVGAHSQVRSRPKPRRVIHERRRTHYDTNPRNSHRCREAARDASCGPPARQAFPCKSATAAHTATRNRIQSGVGMPEPSRRRRPVTAGEAFFAAVAIRRPSGENAASGCNIRRRARLGQSMSRSVCQPSRRRRSIGTLCNNASGDHDDSTI